MCSTDYLQVDVIQIESGDATDAINAACDTALTDYDAPTNAEMEARTLAAASYATASALDAVDNFLDTEIAAILEDTGTTLPAAIAAISAESGAGAIEHVVTVTVDSVAVSGADVWVTSTNDPDDAIVASGETDGNGQVTFHLDAGTYYVWTQISGYNFTNPTEIEVTA
jgi:hypothetical protein